MKQKEGLKHVLSSLIKHVLLVLHYGSNKTIYIYENCMVQKFLFQDIQGNTGMKS